MAMQWHDRREFVRAFHLDLTPPTGGVGDASRRVCQRAARNIRWSLLRIAYRCRDVTANSSYILTSSTNATFGDADDVIRVR